MPKRIGANGRKRKAQRGRGLPKANRAIVLGIAAALLASAAGFLLLRGGTGRLADAVSGALHREDAVITGLSVSGGVHVTNERVIRECGLRFPMRFRELKRVCGRELAARDPWVERLDIGRRGTTALVTVSERRPVALFAHGEVSLVDTLGALLPLDKKLQASLPLVAGLDDSAAGSLDFLTEKSRCRMNRFLAAMHGCDSVLAGRIAQVRFGDNGIAELAVEGCPAVIAIEEQYAAERLQRLVQVFGSMERDSLAPTRIDLSYRNLAFVTTESAGGAAKREKI